MKKHHEVTRLTLTESVMNLQVDGRELTFQLNEISKPLCGATAEERGHFEISPSGYGIHWPLIDEDLSIDGLLGIAHSPATQKMSACPRNHEPNPRKSSR